MSTDGSVSTTLQAAYILHYRQYQESSFIVDAFTLAHGRVTLMARSARASKPRTRALYQPFRPLLLSWVGASDLRTLTGIEESGQAMSMENAQLACGYYINELVLRLLGKDQPQPAVFAYYSLALAELSAQPAGSANTHRDSALQVTLRTFELQLLDALGVLPDLRYCTPDGSAVEPDSQYRYHPANAVAVPVNSKTDGSLPLGIQKEKTRMGEGDSRNASVQADGVTADDGVLISGESLLSLAALEFPSDKVLEDAKQLMRRILRVHLGDRPLNSRELFASLASRE